MIHYIKLENVDKEKAQLLSLGHSEVKLLEQKLTQLIVEQSKSNSNIKNIGSKRDAIARMVSQTQYKLRETNDSIQYKLIVTKDLNKQCKDVER